MDSRCFIGKTFWIVEEKAKVKTGVGNWLGNKGGIGISLKIGEESFLFAGCHLAGNSFSIGMPCWLDKFSWSQQDWEKKKGPESHWERSESANSFQCEKHKSPGFRPVRLCFHLRRPQLPHWWEFRRCPQAALRKKPWCNFVLAWKPQTNLRNTDAAQKWPTWKESPNFFAKGFHWRGNWVSADLQVPEEPAKVWSDFRKEPGVDRQNHLQVKSFKCSWASLLWCCEQLVLEWSQTCFFTVWRSSDAGSERSMMRSLIPRIFCLGHE